MDKSSTPILIALLVVGVGLFYWWEKQKQAALVAAAATPPPDPLGSFAAQTCAATLGAAGAGGSAVGLCATAVGAAEGSGQQLGVGKTGGIVGSVVVGPAFIGAADASMILGAVGGKIAGTSAVNGIHAAQKVNSMFVTAAKKEASLLEFWNW